MTRRAPFEQAEQAARRLAGTIARDLPPGYQFMLFVMSTGAGGFLTYVANVQRDDAVRMTEEWLTNQRARGFTDTDLAPQCSCCGSTETGTSFMGKLRIVRLCHACQTTARPTDQPSPYE